MNQNATVGNADDAVAGQPSHNNVADRIPRSLKTRYAEHSEPIWSTRLIRCLFLVVACLVATNSANAQDTRYLLRGIKSLSLGVVGLDEASKAAELVSRSFATPSCIPQAPPISKLQTDEKAPRFMCA
jgi:hypothetical protein